MLGDSHATAYLPLFDQMSAVNGVRVSVMHAPGCNTYDLQRPIASAHQTACSASVRSALSRIQSEVRPDDIVFLPSLRVPRWSDSWGGLAAIPATQVDARAAGRLALSEAQRDFAPLLNLGARLVLEAPKPVFRSPVFRCVDRYTHDSPACRGGLSVSRADMQRYREPALDRMRTWAGADRRVSIWDPFPTLCPDVECRALTPAGRPLYFDGDHISAHANRLLFPAFNIFWAELTSPISDEPDGSPTKLRSPSQ